MSTTTRSRRPAPIVPSAWQMEQAMTELLKLRDALLAADPSMADDPALFADMMEGEDTTDALGTLARVLRSSIEDDLLADAAKLRKADIAERQKRFEQRRDAKRRVAQSALEALGLSRLEQEDFTASVINTAGGIDVPDPTKLAAEYQRVTVEANKTAIAAAFKEGKAVEGASRGNGGRSLSLRTR